MLVMIGVFTVLYEDLPVDGALDGIAGLGVELVEPLRRILSRKRP